MPERFQEAEENFDVIFTVEERIYDSVLAGRDWCASVIVTAIQYTVCSTYVCFNGVVVLHFDFSVYE